MANNSYYKDTASDKHQSKTLGMNTDAKLYKGSSKQYNLLFPFLSKPPPLGKKIVGIDRSTPACQ